MKLRYLTIFLFVSMWLVVGCNRQNRTDINKAIVVLLNSRISVIEFNKQVTTTKLAQMIQQTSERENLEIEKIEKSDTPSDKPNIIEGDLLSGMTDGFTSFKIKGSEIKNDTAKVKVEFTLGDDLKPIVWVNQFIMVKQDSWKLDNVVYSRVLYGEQNLQAVLRGYIASE